MDGDLAIPALDRDVTVPGVDRDRTAAAGDLRFQGTIVSYARDCTRVAGQVNARIGVEGRVVVGPAGAPDNVTLPIRVAVVQEGLQPKTIMTRLYMRTPLRVAGYETGKEWPRRRAGQSKWRGSWGDVYTRSWHGP